MKRIFIVVVLAMTLSTSMVAQNKKSGKAKVTNTQKSKGQSTQQKAFKEMMAILDKTTRKVKAASSKSEAYIYVQNAQAEIRELQDKYPNGELSEQLTSAQNAEYQRRTNALTQAVMSKR